MTQLFLWEKKPVPEPALMFSYKTHCFPPVNGAYFFSVCVRMAGKGCKCVALSRSPPMCVCRCAATARTHRYTIIPDYPYPCSPLLPPSKRAPLPSLSKTPSVPLILSSSTTLLCCVQVLYYTQDSGFSLTDGGGQ